MAAMLETLALGQGEQTEQGEEGSSGGGDTSVTIVFVLFGLITLLAVGYAVKCYCCPKKRSHHDSDSDDFERN